MQSDEPITLSDRAIARRRDRGAGGHLSAK